VAVDDGPPRLDELGGDLALVDHDEDVGRPDEPDRLEGEQVGIAAADTDHEQAFHRSRRPFDHVCDCTDPASRLRSRTLIERSFEPAREALVSALPSVPGSPCPVCGIVGWINLSGSDGHCVICDTDLQPASDGTWVIDDRD